MCLILNVNSNQCIN